MSERPKMCADCGKLMGVGTTCPYCGADNTRLMSRLKRVAGPGDASGFSITTALVTVNLFLYATALVVGGIGGGGAFDWLTPSYEVLFRIGLQDNRAIEAGQWWRLFLMIFLHLGVLHVAFNCYILYYAGRILEQDLGGRLTFVVYMASGLVGSVGSYFADIGGAGASGAVFGLLGAILARRRLIDGDFQHPLTRQILFLLGINAVFAVFMGGHINHVAHIGGFVAGIGCAAVLTLVPLGRTGAVVVMVASWVTGAATLAAFVLMAVSLFQGGPQDLQAAHGCWRNVATAVVDGLDVQAAEKAERCLGELADLEPPANAARDRAHGGIRAALASFDRGDSAGVDTARREVAAASEQYLAWEHDALPRYGLFRAP